MQAANATRSIFTATAHTASEQGAAVRPSLDAFVASVCSAIRVRGNLGRKLPIRDTSADAESTSFQMAVVR
jgi:hypothetical protein